MTVTIEDRSDRYVFGNDDGVWVIWKRLVRSGDLSVGPGYIGRAILRDGTRLCNGGYPIATSANDPRVQGIGLVGYHWLRALATTDIWQKGWDVDGHKPGPFGVTDSTVIVKPHLKNGRARASFGVELSDGWQPVMHVRYDYVIHPSQVQMWVTMETNEILGDKAFIKEPKICVGLNPPVEDGSRYNGAAVYRADDSILTSFPLEIGDPTKTTRQIGFDTRSRVRFFDTGNGKQTLNIVARACTPGKFHLHTDWENSPFGLDRWAQLSNSRERFSDTPCKPYCLQGPRGPQTVTEGNLTTTETWGPTLTRQWEIAKRPGEPGVELMLHAWEGGSGLPDCLCAAREYVGGERYTTYLSISKGAGWTL